METQKLGNPLDKLYCLIIKREKIVRKADHLESLLYKNDKENLREYELILQHPTKKALKTRHINSIFKALKNLNKSYQKRLAKKEEQIKNFIQENINPSNYGNQE